MDDMFEAAYGMEVCGGAGSTCRTRDGDGNKNGGGVLGLLMVYEFAAVFDVDVNEDPDRFPC